MTSIRKVAEQAGVSIGTVSRVLNNKPGVSAETRKHVNKIAKEIGYFLPKRLPKSAVQVNHIGVLTRPMLKMLPADPFYGEVFHGIEQTCQQNHICVSYSKLEPAGPQLPTLPAMLQNNRIDGIILMGGLPLELVQELEHRSEQPIVLVDNFYPKCSWDAVLIDNLAGSYAATHHLIAHDHTNTAMITGTDHPSIKERQMGFRQAMRDAQLEGRIFETKALNPEAGGLGVEQILETAPETTAIFCSNDLQAIGALSKLQELGISVPADISVIGFDNIATGEYTSPPLSTIHVDRLTMGQLATQTLIDRLNYPDRPVVKSIVGTQLISRKSVSKHYLGKTK